MSVTKKKVDQREVINAIRKIEGIAELMRDSAISAHSTVNGQEVCLHNPVWVKEVSEILKQCCDVFTDELVRVTQ